MIYTTLSLSFLFSGFLIILIFPASPHLTCVNRVFIVEPQWNPRVEKQAVSRAVRLGQAEKATVTRYYVCGTVEQVGTISSCRKPPAQV